MSLDVKVLHMLDRFARVEGKDDFKDNEALRYINQLPSSSQSYLKAEYVKYYFKSKRDYKIEQQVAPLDLFKKDI